MTGGVSLRDHRASILVSALGAAFGVALLLVSHLIDQLVRAATPVGPDGTLSTMLGAVAAVFVGLSLFVGAVVTANTFSTIVAGRTSTIALMRLLGSSARDQRRAVVREGLVVGLLGALVGAVLGSALVVVAVRVLVARGSLPDLEYSYLAPVALLPLVAVVLTTVVAARVGSRRVLVVTPLQATGAAVETPVEARRPQVLRTVVAVLLVLAGSALLALGVVTGLTDATGVVVAFLGGIVSFTGVVVGAHAVMPRVLRLVGRLLGRGQVAQLAAENALRQPERSTRATIGIVIGVTLVTTLSVALETLRGVIRGLVDQDPEYFAQLDAAFTAVLLVMACLVGFSAVIAAVGMVSDMSLSVLQRRRELGLLRALGSTRSQVRRMILAEAAQMTVAAVLVGLVLGVVYGWAGAQAFLGTAAQGRLIAPGISVPLLVVLAGGSALLAGVAAVVPSRRATQVAPVVALSTR